MNMSAVPILLLVSAETVRSTRHLTNQHERSGLNLSVGVGEYAASWLAASLASGLLWLVLY